MLVEFLNTVLEHSLLVPQHITACKVLSTPTQSASTATHTSSRVPQHITMSWVPQRSPLVPQHTQVHEYLSTLLCVMSWVPQHSSRTQSASTSTHNSPPPISVCNVLSTSTFSASSSTHTSPQVPQIVDLCVWRYYWVALVSRIN